MDKRAIRTPDGARDILKYNINVIYHLPKKYKNLNKALKDVRRDLLNLFKFCKDNEPIIWKQKYVWFVDNGRLTRVVRNRTTKSTSNRHFNFLCCLDAIHKLEQTKGNMTGVNMTFLLNEREKGKRIGINTFTIYKYTEKQLERMEQRAAELLQHGITPGNISNDKLKASGCEALAKEVFYLNSEESLQHKEKVFNTVMDLLQQLCSEKGYTDKKELCSRLEWNRNKLDKYLNIFKNTWQQLYQYKAPNKAETEQYNLKSKAWIITRR